MKAEMTPEGVIVIRPESGAEEFALNEWNRRALIKTELLSIAEKALLRSSMLRIEHEPVAIIRESSQ